MRSKKDKVLSGVCGGIGEYFDIDSTIVRLAFIILIFISFSTAVIVYLISSIIIPMDDGIIYQDNYEETTSQRENDNERNKRNEKIRKNTPLFLGIGLILWGGYLLADKLYPSIFISLRGLRNYWPILLILLGLYVIFQPKNK